MAERRLRTEGRWGGSLITAASVFELNNDQTDVSTNVDPSDVFGACKKRNGFAKYAETVASPSGSDQAANVYHWVMNDGTEKTVLVEGTKVWDVTADPETDITGTLSLTAGQHVAIVPFSNKLYFFPGGSGNTMKVWTGSGTIGNPTEAPADGSKYAVAHRNRIYVAGDPDNPNQVEVSGSSDGEDYSSAENHFKFVVGEDDGDVIQGLMPSGDAIVRGPLYVLKRDATHMWVGIGPHDGEAAVRKVADVGLVSEHGMAQLESAVAFASRDGIYTIEGYRLAKLSVRVEPTYQAIATKSQIVLGRYRDQLWCIYDDDDDGENDAALVLDYTRGVWSKYTNIRAHAVTRLKDGSLVGLNRAGTQLYKYDTGTDDDGTAITMTRETKWLDLGPWEHEAAFQNFHVLAEATGAYNLTVQSRFEDEASWHEHTTALSLDGDGFVRQKFNFPPKRKRFVKLRISNAESGATVRVFRYAVEGFGYAATGTGG